MKNILSRVAAVICALILLLVSIPVYNIFVYAGEESITVEVKVLDPKETSIIPYEDTEGNLTGGADLTFVSDTNDTIITEVKFQYNDENKTYTLQAKVSKTSSLYIQAEYNGFKGKTVYEKDKNAYTVGIEAEKLTLNDNENYKDGVYTADYNKDNSRITPLGVSNKKVEVYYEIDNAQDNTCGATVNSGVIKYTKVGDATIIVKTDDPFYEETRYTLHIRNVLTSKEKYEQEWGGDSQNKKYNEVNLDELVNKGYSDEEIKYTIDNTDGFSLNKNVLSWSRADIQTTVNAETESGGKTQFDFSVNRKQLKLTVSYESDKTDEKVNVKSGDTINLSYGDYYNNTLKFTYEYEPDDKQKVKVSSDNENVLKVDDGVVTIKGVGTANLKFTIDNANYEIESDMNCTINVLPVKAEAIISYNGETINNTTNTCEISEEKIKSDNTIDKCWDIRYEGLLKDSDENNLKPQYTCSDSTLTINRDTGNISDTEEIERNKEYTIKVSWDNGIYSVAETSFIFKIKGENKSEDPDIKYSKLEVKDPSNPTDEEAKSPFNEYISRDGERWTTTKDIYVYSEIYKFSSSREDVILTNPYKLDIPGECGGLKEHSLFKWLSFASPKYRVYFGVDLEAPTITNVSFGGNIKVNADNKFATAYGDWSVTVECADNFYDGVELYNEDVKVDSVTATEKSSNGNSHTVMLSIPKDAVTSSGNLEIRVYEKSGRYTEYVIGDFVQEAADGSNTDISNIEFNTSGVNTYSKGNIIYADKDVDFNCTVKNDVSGISSVVTKINGTEIKDDKCSREFLIDEDNPSRMKEAFTINWNTAAYSASGKCEIEVAVTDNSGYTKKITRTIYIDNKAPEAASVSISAANNKGVNNESGNFYSDSITVTIGVTDEGSGAARAVLYVGDSKLSDADVKSGKATFTIPVETEGNVSFNLIDNVGNTNENVKLSDINKAQSVYKSSYIVTEQNVSVVDISATRPADNDEWYNAGITCNVAVTETGVSSGIRSVEVTVNGKRYTGDDNIAGIIKEKLYTVNIDEAMIGELVNQNGAYTIKVVTTDNAGNEASSEKTFYIDMTAPVVSEITGPAEGAAYSSDVDISFTVSEAPFNESGNHTTVSVERTLDGETAHNDITYDSSDNTLDKTYRFTEDGIYTISVSSVDNAGNISNTRTTSFTIDKIAPVINVTGVTSDTYYSDPVTMTLNVTESNYSDNSVSITATRDNSGTISNVQLEEFTGTEKSSTRDYVFSEDGTYTVAVNAVDRAGNTAAEQIYTFTVDNTVPEVVISGIDAKNKNINPVVAITDEYFDSYSVRLYKRGITLNGRTTATPTGSVDVTDRFAQTVSTSDKGVTVAIEEFERKQENDGVYTLVVESADKAGNTHPEAYTFVVNRFGSVYTFDNALDDYIRKAYVKSIDRDLVITEYNSDVIEDNSASVRITRDGYPITDIEYTAPDIVNKEMLNADSEWNSYSYTIKASNFALDGVYEIVVSSTDGENNISENINYDEMMIKFSVDSTAPTLVSVTGLDKSSINSNKQTVTYNVFDAIGIAKVVVYNGNDVISEVDELDDNINYTGTFELGEGTYKNIRFYIEDLAGNVTDSGNSDNQGNVAAYNSDVTISTNFFVRLFNNKPLFYAVTGGGVVVAGGAGTFAILLRRKKLLAKAVLKAMK